MSDASSASSTGKKKTARSRARSESDASEGSPSSRRGRRGHRAAHVRRRSDAPRCRSAFGQFVRPNLTPVDSSGAQPSLAALPPLPYAYAPPRRGRARHRHRACGSAPPAARRCASATAASRSRRARSSGIAWNAIKELTWDRGARSRAPRRHRRDGQRRRLDPGGEELRRRRRLDPPRSARAHLRRWWRSTQETADEVDVVSADAGELLHARAAAGRRQALRSVRRRRRL